MASIPTFVWGDETCLRIKDLRDQGWSWRQIGRELGVNAASLNRRFTQLNEEHDGIPDRHYSENSEKGEATLKFTTNKPVKTLKQALAVAEVDLKTWYVHSWDARLWTTPLNIKRGQKKEIVKKPRYNASTKCIEDHEEEELRWRSSKATQQQQYLVSMKLRRKTPEVQSVESLFEEISKHGKIELPTYNRPVVDGDCKRALEISLLDPHLGLRCFQPQADMAWSLDEAEEAFKATTEQLLKQVKIFGPFEEIVVPIGNDYFHADSIWHTTTGGTAQPEMESLHEVYLRGEKLMLWYTERLRKFGVKLKILSIPGNHDRFTSFTLARLIRAFYEGAKIKNISVDASPSPYKFWNYGVNLIGFEHGHSVSPIRLAALMANETRTNHWRDARYCEWHLGDQHRKGSGKPSTFEEQGVSVEYLPSLTPPNEWHRLKSFNWQKRGAMAFVYDYKCGPLARLQVNFDSYTGKHLGAA